jgi:hypothetical protein
MMHHWSQAMQLKVTTSTSVQIAWKKLRDRRTRKAYSLLEIMPAVRVDPLLPPHPTSITLQTQTASSNFNTHSCDNPDKRTHPKQPQTSFWSQRRLFPNLSNCRENNHNTVLKVNSKFSSSQTQTSTTRIKCNYNNLVSIIFDTSTHHHCHNEMQWLAVISICWIHQLLAVCVTVHNNKLLRISSKQSHDNLPLFNLSHFWKEQKGSLSHNAAGNH